ncbi:MAG TPA: carboxypeptidase-like regulatory domain-containing protein, partial [Bryobacteraceae bacterium]|nr:carboxypeptidase-like regulatory domain-containing protein [Bryobacteraceae bacterium]
MTRLVISQRIRLASLAIAIVPLLYGQAERASLAGTVTDNSGAVLPAAAVKVTNDATNTSVSLETDSSGDYRAVNLTPGSYSVQTEKQGFQRYVTRGIVL